MAPHMPTSEGPSAVVGASEGLPVEYEATGLEGTSFLVPIGQTVNNSTYAIVYAPAGITNVPLLDLPNTPGDRTTTYFRVTTAVQLAAGETLVFVLFGA
jgi:hypothetical protein